MCFTTSMFLVSMMKAGHYLGKLQQKFSPSHLPVEEQWLHFLSTKSHACPQMCSSNNVRRVTADCLRRPEQGGKARQDSPHGARACSLLHRLHWLHSECETPLHSMRTSGWLLTHCNYLSGIPRCLTVQPAKSRRATAPQTSHRKLSVLSFPISTPTWMTLFNITPQQSIGKKGWKGWFLFIRKTTIGRGGNGFFF